MSLGVNEKNTLIIADTHEPFSHKYYLDFCLETKKRYKCNQVFHIGDLVDNHALSYFDKDPDGLSSGDEYRKTRLKLEKWYKAFPKVKLCKGNHDKLLERKALTHGISKHFVKDFRTVWGLPDDWEYEDYYYHLGIKIFHGTGFSGKFPHVQAMMANRMRVVIGHLHAVAGVEFSASDIDCVYGLAVGSGIDRKAFAFGYGKDLRYKPIVSCGVILDDGEDPFVVRMKL